jgi:Fe-S-cluster containining protein
LGRADRRIILKQSMAAISKGGMDLRAASSDQFWAVAAATRVLYDMLTGKAPARASKAAEWAHEFFETSLKKNPSEHKIECVKGCAHCCRVTVTALAPEIFLAANAVRAAHPNDFEAARAAIRAAESSTRGLSPMERGKRRLPCVLLKDNACTIYAARPGACRAAASASAKACEIAFAGGNAGIPTPAVWTTLRNAGLQAMWAALTAAEMPSEQYEFNEAITLALEDPGAEARWLKGEDVFRGAARLRNDNPAVVENNRKVVAQLVAGALGREMPM